MRRKLSQVILLNTAAVPVQTEGKRDKGRVVPMIQDAGRNPTRVQRLLIPTLKMSNHKILPLPALCRFHHKLQPMSQSLTALRRLRHRLQTLPQSLTALFHLHRHRLQTLPQSLMALYHLQHKHHMTF